MMEVVRERFRIVELLRYHDRNISEIAKELEITQKTASRYVENLERSRVIVTRYRKDDREKCYTISRAFADFFDSIYLNPFGDFIRGTDEQPRKVKR